MKTTLTVYDHLMGNARTITSFSVMMRNRAYLGGDGVGKWESEAHFAFTPPASKKTAVFSLFHDIGKE